VMSKIKRTPMQEPVSAVPCPSFGSKRESGKIEWKIGFPCGHSVYRRALVEEWSRAANHKGSWTVTFRLRPPPKRILCNACEYIRMYGAHNYERVYGKEQA